MLRFIWKYTYSFLLGIWHLLLWHSRLLLRLAMAAGLVLAIIAGAWQFWFIPRQEQYRPLLVAELSRLTGMQIEIGALSGGWDGISPKLILQNLRAYDNQHQPTLSFSRLQGALSWWALPLGKLHFSELELVSPEIKMLHLYSGRWRVAGVVIGEKRQDSSSGFINWLLEQRTLNITNGRLLLQDELQAVPELTLTGIDLRASNFFGWRKLNFGLTPPAGVGQRITGSGVVRGDDIDSPEAWSGHIGMNLPQVGLAQLHGFLVGFLPDSTKNYPQIQEGNGKLGFTLAFSAKKIDRLEADLQLEKLKLLHDQQVFDLPLLSLEARWESLKKRQQLTLAVRDITGSSGPLLHGSQINYSVAAAEHDLQLRDLNLAGLADYAALLPPVWRERMAGATLVGNVANLHLGWKGDWHQPGAWRGEIDVQGLALNAPRWLPQLGTLDIRTSFDDKTGSATLRSQELRLDYPQQFVEPLMLTHFDADIRWNHSENGWDFVADKLVLSNAEAAMELTGRYRWDGSKLGSIDLKGGIQRIPANRVHVYLPRVVGDDTLVWLKDSLRSGVARDGKVEWHGPIDRFPYVDGSGLFRITAAAQDVTLDYANGWPVISGISGELRFEAQGMTIHASHARIYDVQLRNVIARIPDLSANSHLLIDGKAEGAMADYLRFVRESPVKEATEGNLDTLKADGNAALDLKLDIPLEDTDKSKVFGRLHLQGNRLDFGQPVPLLTQTVGQVEFTESGLKINEANAKSLGGSVKLSGVTDRTGTIKLNLYGDAALLEVARQYSLPQVKRMEGRVAFQGDLSVGKEGYDLVLNSPLTSAQLDLPAPIGKRLGESRPLHLHISGNDKQQSVDFAYDKLLQGVLSQQGDKPYVGTIALGAMRPTVVPGAKGIQIVGGWPELDFSAWQSLQGDDGNATSISNVDLKFGRLSAWGKFLSAVQIKAAPSAQGWSIQLASDQASGRVQWHSGVQPSLSGKLDKLFLPLPVDTAAALPQASAAQNSPPEPKPSLDLSVDNFRYKTSELGQLVLNASPQGEIWRLNSVTLNNPDGRFQMNGVWQGSGTSERTSAKFELKSENTGKLLARLGYPDALLRAPTVISGNGSWVGSPFSPHYESMQGTLRLDVEAGQFAKIDPGAGRLLSIISLQSLPRRISLDFRDVFSDGLEFDAISGDAVIEKGIVHTDNLAIKSSAAHISFKGDANLANETQNLRVRIVPQIGDAASIAAVVAVNPIAGVAAFALQRMLKDPLGQIVSYEYDITGEWADPKVNKAK